jgi:hypothetical protein
MKRVFVLVIVVCLVALMVFVTAMAQSDDSVYVNPLLWDPSTVVSSDQNVILTIGWRACRRGAVQMFLTASRQEWVFDGVSLFDSYQEANQYYGPITTMPLVPGHEACIGKVTELWLTRWNYEIGTLAPGEHTLDYVLWLAHPVTDVADYDGDGRPDLLEGTMVEASTTIQVAGE